MLTFRIVGISLLVLGVLASVVILLLPLGILQNASIFPDEPERSLWLLFLLGLTFGGILFAVGLENGSLWSYAKAGGSGLLVLGLASAVEIFLIMARLPSARHTTSLWWLFVICTVLGGLAVYVAKIAKRVERAKREEMAKKEEMAKRMECKAEDSWRQEKRRVYLFKARR
jgi:hypothetical protein